jgi:hypothetical protein
MGLFIIFAVLIGLLVVISRDQQQHSRSGHRKHFNSNSSDDIPMFFGSSYSSGDPRANSYGGNENYIYNIDSSTKGYGVNEDYIYNIDSGSSGYSAGDVSGDGYSAGDAGSSGYSGGDASSGGYSGGDAGGGF